MLIRRRSDDNDELFAKEVLGDFGQVTREDDLGHWERLLPWPASEGGSA